MDTYRIARVWIVLAIVAVTSAWAIAPAVAASGGIGSATTEVQLVSVAGQIEQVPQSVVIGGGSGFATTDPPRLGKDSISAAMEFIAAFGSGVHNIDGSDHRQSAEADEDAPDSSSAPTVITLPAAVAEAATANVALSALTAAVDPDVPSARSDLAEVEFDATALAGVVGLQGTIAGLLNESHPEEAHASQGLYVELLQVLTIGSLMSQLGRSADDLALVSDLVLFAQDMGLPASAAQPLIDAQSDWEEADDDEKAWLQAIEDLADTDPSNDADAIAVVGAMALKYADELTGDPFDASVVSSTMALVKGPLQAAIDAAREVLADEIAELPLLSFHGLSIGAVAEATDDSSAAQASISWVAAEVAGHQVPTVDSSEEAIAEMTSLVVDTVNILGDAVGMNLALDLEIGRKVESAGTDGDYRMARSEMTVVSLEVSTEQPDASVVLEVLSLQAFAEHVPVSPGSTGDPEPTRGPGLPNTGAEPILFLAGIGTIGLAWRLRRWLGDAA